MPRMAQDPHDQQGPYASLIREIREIDVLSSVSSLLSWDEQTQMPPLATPPPLKRQEPACAGSPARGEHYDALLDEYEPGETAQGLAKVFESLRGPLVDLIGRITQSPRKAPDHLVHRHFPAAAQEKLA